jgi:hypothetical protein
MNAPLEFAAWLAHQNDGALNAELTAAMGEMVDKVRIVNKPGRIVLDVTVKPHSGEIVLVGTKITTKYPEPDRPADVWFSTEGGLTKQRPDTPSLFEPESETEEPTE